MGKAEDAFHRRQQAELERQAAEMAASEQRASALRALVGPAIQNALARLEANGFPGAELYTEKRFFGLLTRERAYWMVPIGMTTIRSDPVTYSAILFADGSLHSTGAMFPFPPGGKLEPTKLSEEALEMLLPYLKQLG